MALRMSFQQALALVDGLSCVVLADAARYAVVSRRTPAGAWRLVATDGHRHLFQLELDSAGAEAHMASLGRAHEDWGAYFNRIRRAFAHNLTLDLPRESHRQQQQQQQQQQNISPATLTLWCEDGRGAELLSYTYVLEPHKGEDLASRIARVLLDTAKLLENTQTELRTVKHELQQLREEQRRRLEEEQQQHGVPPTKEEGTGLGGRRGGFGDAAGEAAQLQRGYGARAPFAGAGAIRTDGPRPGAGKSLANPGYSRKRARGAQIILPEDDDDE